MFSTSAFLALAMLAPADTDSSSTAEVREIFEEWCTFCHDDSGEPTEPGGLDLELEPSQLIGRDSVATGTPLVVPGKPDDSYLVQKLVGAPDIAGEPMPQGGDALPPPQLETIRTWIAGLDEDVETAKPPGATRAGASGEGEGPADASPRSPAVRRGPPPFYGIQHIVLPTTATLGRNRLMYRIDHRFGRIGTERGAFGLDVGVVMSLGLAYGILDGWDVLLRRTNSRKGWELGTKYVGLRQEEGWPVSLGGYASMELYRAFDIRHPVSGNFMVMLSRLWMERWSTMLTVGYHFRTNHNARVVLEFEDHRPLVEDNRDTLTLGVGSTVRLGTKKRWGIDIEYFFPIPDQSSPNYFYYRGGDADPDGTIIGAWSIGASYRIGLHFFQVFLTNNREIHTGLAAPGGQTGNPFDTPGMSSENPLHELNFFLGFNLIRKFNLGQ